MVGVIVALAVESAAALAALAMVTLALAMMAQEFIRQVTALHDFGMRPGDCSKVDQWQNIESTTYHASCGVNSASSIAFYSDCLYDFNFCVCF